MNHQDLYGLASAIVLAVQVDNTSDVALSSSTGSPLWRDEPPSALNAQKPRPLLPKDAVEAEQVNQAPAKQADMPEPVLVTFRSRDDGAGAGLAEFFGIKQPEPEVKAMWMMPAAGRGR